MWFELNLKTVHVLVYVMKFTFSLLFSSYPPPIYNRLVFLIHSEVNILTQLLQGYSMLEKSRKSLMIWKERAIRYRYMDMKIYKDLTQCIVQWYMILHCSWRHLCVSHSQDVLDRFNYQMDTSRLFSSKRCLASIIICIINLCRVVSL